MRGCWWCLKKDGGLIEQDDGKRVHPACMDQYEESENVIEQDRARDARRHSLGLIDYPDVLEGHK